MSNANRREAMKSLGAAAAVAGLASESNASPIIAASGVQCPWAKTQDRVWLGGEYWANPMEDWRVVDGGAEVQSGGGGRNIHLITHQITDPKQGFETSVHIRRVAESKTDGGAGFRIGVKSEINEHRSNVFAKNGVQAGLRDGVLFVGRSEVKCEADVEAGVTLTLKAAATGEGGNKAIELTLIAGETTVSAQVAADQLRGNLALVSNFDFKLGKQQGARYRFEDWTAAGDAFLIDESRRFGPILWSMYSLSDSRSDEGFVMKLSALTGPLGEQDNQSVELFIESEGEWASLGTAALDTDAWTATFRIPHWDASKQIPFRLVYQEKHTDSTTTESEWTGTIRANPTGRPLRMAALTCQNDYGFPYEPVADNVAALEPDLIYFSGDQLYEGHGGFGLIREPAVPAILNYLRKYYQFGWAFREPMRHAPTLCIPDDHDVFQGNIWGEGGAKMKDLDQGTSSKGGYREPARMVNAVHKTNCAHHPDFYDATPAKQGISVYYGDMVYGNVSFAILGDRQFKSGPERVETGSGRADHVKDMDVDTSKLDKPGLVLLGERQEEFLKAWCDDWRGHSMKVLLSQTVFAGAATHHGGKDGYLKADLDCGGWPQTARDRAVKIIRKGLPLHINGDQHLASLVQYGVDEQRDSCWSFCTPAISAGYPRWWRADEVGMPHENRPKHGNANTGEYLDGLGNKAYVYAVGNPVVGRDRNRYKKAHEKASGFGFVTIDTEAKTYYLEAFRFLVDATNPGPEDQFPGWPLLIHQEENGGQNRIS
ncbi:MAG: alkaline phosphatase D family protein [Planctomycetota bacterium]